MTQVLQVGDLKPSLASTLAASYDAVVLPTDDGERSAYLTERGSEVRVVVTSGRFGVDADLMAELPSLAAVCNFGVGYDTTDVAAAQERGVVVSHTPDVLTDCVADTALGLALDVVRGLTHADRFVRDGSWSASRSFPLRRRLSGTRVGILGLGRIGSAIARRFEAFGCSIAYHSRREVPGASHRYAATPLELAASVDVLVVATSGGPDSAGLVDRSVLEALGPAGYLVNIARGSVVDEDALVDLLVSGGLAGAGLDVFAHEPRVPKALLGLDNVVLLPHVGSATVETREAMERLTLENLAAFLSRGELVTPVPESAR